jgi:hypothetical protein
MVNHKWTMRPEGLTCDDCGEINGFKKKNGDKDSTDTENSENDY